MFPAIDGRMSQPEYFRLIRDAEAGWGREVRGILLGAILTALIETDTQQAILTHSAQRKSTPKALRHDISEMLNEFCRMRGVSYHADPGSPMLNVACRPLR